MVISRFLNVAIGRLYKDYKNWDTLDKAITYVDIDSEDRSLLVDMVIPTAKIHFKDIDRNEEIEIDNLK